MAACFIEVVLHHFANHVCERRGRHPAQFALGLAWVAQQGFHFGGAEVFRVDCDDGLAHDGAGRLVAGDAGDDAFFIDAAALPGEGDAQFSGRRFDELAHRILHAGGDDEVFGRFLLQHQPLHFNVVARMAPVAQRVHVAQEQIFFEALGDVGQRARDLARDEGFAPAR